MHAFLGTGDVLNVFLSEQSRDPIANSKSSESNKRTYTCSTCLQSKTALFWHNDPNDKTLKRCKACYRKFLKENLESLGVRCTNCNATTSCQWYKDPKDKTLKRCQACYRKFLKEKQASLGIHCSNCNATTSCQWYKDPKDTALKRCEACYQKALKENLESLRVRCSGCEATTSFQWYNDPDDKTLKRCQACYRKANRKRKASQMDPLDEAAAKKLPSSSPLPDLLKGFSEEDRLDLIELLLDPES